MRSAVRWAAAITFGSLLAPAADLECRVELAIYDARGVRQAFYIESVIPQQLRSLKDLPVKFRDSFRVSKDSRTTVEFARTWTTSEGFKVELADERGRKLEVNVPAYRCKYRYSTVHVERSQRSDVAYYVAHGRVTGCTLTGDWWVRAVPMFAASVYASSFDGFVDTKTGEIILAGIQAPIRHLVILGNDNVPIRTIAIDIDPSRPNEMPLIKLTSLCK